MLQSMQANATEHSTEHATELVSSAVLMYVGQVDKSFIALASEVLKETRLFILRFVRGSRARKSDTGRLADTG